jgi:hypothetical protein
VGLFILDSLGIALQGDAGDARDVIGFHNDYLDPFRAAGITLLVIDHQGKRRRANATRASARSAPSSRRTSPAACCRWNPATAARGY